MGKNVLIVDDDNYLTEDLQYFIEDAGHKCDVFDNSETLYSNIKDLDKYDFIILDIMMRKPSNLIIKAGYESGEQLYEIIREEYPKKNIIILSAKNFNDMKIKFSKEKKVFIVEKPLSGNMSEIIKIM